MAGTVAGLSLRWTDAPEVIAAVVLRYNSQQSGTGVSVACFWSYGGKRDHLRTQTSNFQGPCCKSAFYEVRRFLVSGTVSDPYKEYHLGLHRIMDLPGLLLAGIGNGQNTQPAVLKQGNYVIYLKEASELLIC